MRRCKASFFPLFSFPELVFLCTRINFLVHLAVNILCSESKGESEEVVRVKVDKKVETCDGFLVIKGTVVYDSPRSLYT